MAVWTTGFEVGDDDYYENDQGWTYFGSTTGVTNTAGEFHQSLTGRGGSWGLFIEDDALTPEFSSGGRWLHFWVNAISNTGDYFGLEFRAAGGGSSNAALRFEPTGAITLRMGGFVGSIVGGGAFNPSTPHWIAIEMVAQSSPNGLCNVYVDGVLSLAVSGIDLQNTGTADWAQILFSANSNGDYSIDDIIVTDVSEGQLVEHYLFPLLPDGNDLINSESTSTGGAGSYTNVDELPPDDVTTYNEFTVANTDRYTAANIGFSPNNIHSVTVINKGSADAGLTQGQTVCATDSAGGGVTEALGTAITLTGAGTYDAWQDSFNVDPDTGTAWTPSGLDDLRIGVRFT